MKNIVVVLILLTISASVFGQHRRTSNKLTMTLSTASGKVTGRSNKLAFGTDKGKQSGISNTLYMGVPSKNSVASVVTHNPEPHPEPTTTKSAGGDAIESTTAVVSTVVVSAPVLNSVPESTAQRSTSQPVATKPASSGLGPEYVSSLPKYTALVIGVSEYKYSNQGLPSLENPVRDATNVYNILTKTYTFDTASSRLLKNPTRQEIIDALEQLSSEMTAKDNLLVFYAGHGYYDKSKEFGYWLPSDSKSTSRGEWIPNSTIKDYLSAIPSKHTLLITDACFGGSIFKSRAVDATTFLKVHDLYKDPSKRAITSGNLTEVPDKSLFLDQLLKKLNENEEDFLPAQKLFNRIYEPIINNSSAVPQFGVIQGAGDEGGDFIFIKRN